MPHYIWKTQARKAILLDQKERSRRRVPNTIARHARLQNMTYSSKLKVDAGLYTREE